MKQKVAIVGASGVVGRALLEYLQLVGVPVLGLSRRPPADLPDARFEQLDLMNAAACRDCVSRHLNDVTHVVYAALYEKPGLIAGWHEQDQMQTNLAMLENFLEPLRQSRSLRHVTLLQGTKAYGAHVSPMKIPGLERDPRHPHNNFYWLQQDYLTDLCASQDWRYTIWRPQIIIGHALNAPMNMLAAIGVYAAIKRSRGEGLAYPGGPSGISELIDADLLAKAIHHSFDNEAFANETFNITNGDVFRWQDAWPAIASNLQMNAAEPARLQLSATLYGAEPEWQQIVESQGLRPYSIRQLVGDSFFYADALFNTHGDTPPPPALLSTIKLRQAGFNECIDTAIMFERWFKKLKQLKVLPV